MAAISPTKLKSLISFIITESDHALGKIELAKIVYLIDVESVRFTGETITKENYTRQEKGPLAFNFTDSINEMNGFEIKVSTGKSRGGSTIPKHNHTTGENHRFTPNLSPTELALAKRVLEKIKNLDPLDIEKLAYTTEPMLKILEKEKIIGSPLIGERIDFSSIAQNTILSKWRENMKKEQKPDLAFEEFLIEESREIDELLSSLR